MARMRLTLASIKDLDNGRVHAAWGHELAHVVKDCYDRPNDGKARKVTLQASLTPKGEEAVDIELEITSSVPPRRSRPFEMAIAPRDGDLIFNDASQDDVRQGTLDEVVVDPAPAPAAGAGARKGTLKYDDLKGLKDGE